MDELTSQVKNSLDEARLLILVVQVVLGFQMRAPFEERFADLSPALRDCHAIALTLLLLAFVVFVAPAPFVELAYGGETATRERTYTTFMMGAGLLPFMVALAINMFVVADVAVSSTAAWTLGIAFAAASGWCWYGLGIANRKRRAERAVTHRTSLPDRVREIMTESRMVLPGALALLGFQFATVFTAAFDRLSHTVKLVHIASMSAIALATILLIAPASFHRIAFDGEDSPRVVDVAVRFVIWALIPLSIGIACAVGVVATQMRLGSTAVVLLPLGTVAASAYFWFVYPLGERRRRRLVREAGGRE